MQSRRSPLSMGMAASFQTRCKRRKFRGRKSASCKIVTPSICSTECLSWTTQSAYRLRMRWSIPSSIRLTGVTTMWMSRLPQWVLHNLEVPLSDRACKEWAQWMQIHLDMFNPQEVWSIPVVHNWFIKHNGSLLDKRIFRCALKVPWEPAWPQIDTPFEVIVLDKLSQRDNSI